MAARLRGRVILTVPGRGLAALDLARVSLGVNPWLASPRNASGQALAIWETSAPDAQGAVVVLTAAQGERRHALRLLAPGRPPRLLREGPGEPLWDRPVSALALSADGARLAFVAARDATQRYRPLQEGTLTVLELASAPAASDAPAAPLPLNATWVGVSHALGQRPAWLTGHARLVVAAAGPLGRAQAAPTAPERQPDPELRLIDLARGTDEFLTHGHSPIASTDGRSLLLTRGPSFELFVLELDSLRERRVPRLHGLGVPVAWIDGRYLLYIGTPHPQAPVGQTRNNSPLVGPKAMRALKVQDLATGEVLTLLEGVDPRTKVTMGP